MKLATRLAALVVLAIATIWLFGIGTPGAMNFPRPFNSERWKAAEVGSYERCAMVTDLRYRVGLIGKTKSEVVNLLGTDIEGSIDPPKVYGLCLSFADLYILEIEWMNGRVVSTMVRDT